MANPKDETGRSIPREGTLARVRYERLRSKPSSKFRKPILVGDLVRMRGRISCGQLLQIGPGRGEALVTWDDEISTSPLDPVCDLGVLREAFPAWVREERWGDLGGLDKR